MTTEQRKETIATALDELLKGKDYVMFPYNDTMYSFIKTESLQSLHQKVERLEEIIKAADEVVQRGYSPGSVDTSGFGENDKYYEALEHYNKLKSKLPSGI